MTTSSPPGTFRCGDRSLRLPMRSPRLLLRPALPSDVPALVELLNDPVVHRGTLRVPYPYRRADALAYLRRLRKQLRGGSQLSLQIVRRSDGRLVGGIGFHDLSPPESCEVGYWVGAPYRRKGYASEALDRMLRAAYGPLGLHRVTAGVFPFNRASMAVVRRAGFRREGLARESHQKEGRWVSEVRFGRLRTDPPPRGRARRSRR
jgi:[ribosomal protein S5]-alanine N-acetyltransferase